MENKKIGSLHFSQNSVEEVATKISLQLEKIFKSALDETKLSQFQEFRQAVDWAKESENINLEKLSNRDYAKSNGLSISFESKNQ